MMRPRLSTFILASAFGTAATLGTTAYGQCVFFSDAECNLVEAEWGPYDADTFPDPNNQIGLATPILGLDEFGDSVALELFQEAKVNGLLGRWFITDPDTGDVTGADSDTDWYRVRLTEPARLIITGAVGNLNPDTGAVDPWAYDPDTGVGNRFVMLVYDFNNSNTQFFGQQIWGGCESATSTLPSGGSVEYVYVPAGEYAIGLDTRYAESTTSATEGPSNTKYDGPVNFSLSVFALPLGDAACGTGSQPCDEVAATPGCADPACCDLVCVSAPDCCAVQWDQSCIDQGVVDCGLFQYACDPNASLTPNDCVGNFQYVSLASGEAVVVDFDNTGALTDGPNDVVNLCGSPMGRDLWYLVGPTPAAGNIGISMCGTGTNGDTVMNFFYDPSYNPSLGIGDPSLLPDQYIGCSDDECDDDGDGETDVGGPSEGTIVYAPEGVFILVRVGSWYDGGPEGADAVDPSAGQMVFSFFSEMYSNDGADILQVGTSLYGTGGVSAGGRLTAANSTTAPNNWAYRKTMLPFTIENAGDFDTISMGGYFSSTQPPANVQAIAWEILARPDELDPDTGELVESFSVYTDNVFDPVADPNDSSLVLFSGNDPTYTPASDGRDAYTAVGFGPLRFLLDVAEPVALDPGRYWITAWGVNSDINVTSLFSMPACAQAPEAYGSDDEVTGVFEPVLALNGRIPDSTVDGETTGTLGEFRWAYFLRPGYNTANVWWAAHYFTDGIKSSIEVNTIPFALQRRTFANACPGDLDGSTFVDAGDIGSLLILFGSEGGPGDLDGSGFVDSGDIGSLLVLFGACP
jgi:hypothetical protein